MLSALHTAALQGVDACPVQVEVDVSFGMPMFTMVGLPDASVRESRDRVRAAIRNSGFEFPPHRITVNLAPADVRKAGAAFDLPIALGILAAQGVFEPEALADTLVLGEVSLDGRIQATRGVLPVVAAARRWGMRRVLLPAANAGEAAVVLSSGILPVSSIRPPCRSCLRRQVGRRRRTETSPMWLDSRSGAGLSRSPPRAVITSCSWVRPVQERR